MQNFLLCIVFFILPWFGHSQSNASLSSNNQPQGTFPAVITDNNVVVQSYHYETHNKQSYLFIDIEPSEYAKLIPNTPRSWSDAQRRCLPMKGKCVQGDINIVIKPK